MERTDECTESEKKRGYATKLHGWSPLRNLVGPLQQSVINTATTTWLPLHGRFDWPRPQRPREWRSFLKNGRDAPSQPCRRSAFLLLQSGKNIRLFPAIQIQSSGFWPGKNNHHASKHDFPSPRSAPTWESFSLLYQRFRPGVIRVLL